MEHAVSGIFWSMHPESILYHTLVNTELKEARILPGTPQNDDDRSAQLQSTAQRYTLCLDKSSELEEAIFS